MKKIIVVLCCLLLIIPLIGCGSSSACGGTTFVNMSGETVTVSAGEDSGIQFDAFTLTENAEHKVCGDDDNDIMGVYTWETGETYSKGLTWSGGDFCIYILDDYSATTGECD